MSNPRLPQTWIDWVCLIFALLGTAWLVYEILTRFAWM
jgi:hypothetical protein